MNIITTCPQAWQDTGAYWYLKNLEFVCNSKHISWEQFQGNTGDFVITCGLGEIDLFKLKRQKFRIGVLFCSPLAQAHVVPSSTNGDLDSLLRYVNMLKSGDIDYIFLASEQLAYLFKNEKIIYLPAPLHWEDFSISTMEERRGLGYFGTMDKHKNLATMFGAVKSSGVEDSFIITGQEKTHMCSFFSNLFDMKNIVVLPRLPRNQLLDVMSKIKLGIQISLSESFNYTTWELSMLEVPNVVSPSINWYAGEEPLREFCMIGNLDDFGEVSNKIRRIYNDSSLYLRLCIMSKEIAMSKMKRNNQRIQEILGKI